MSGKENFKKVKDRGKVFILPLKEEKKKKERQKAEHQKEEKKNGGGE